MEDSKRAFACNLRVFRAKAKLTRKQLSELCDLPVYDIIRYETSQTFVRFSDAEKIAKALGIEPYRLFKAPNYWDPSHKREINNTWHGRLLRFDEMSEISPTEKEAPA